MDPDRNLRGGDPAVGSLSRVFLMKFAILSDVHGNDIALRNCLDYCSREGVDKIIFLGDAIGYLPDPNNVLNILKRKSAEFLIGNHEAMLLGYLKIEHQKDLSYQLQNIKNKISKGNLKYLTGKVPYLLMKTKRKNVLCIHGSPWDPLTGYIYPDFRMSAFNRLPFDVIFQGHTHYPFIKKSGKITIVNVGSCGLPRDQGGLSSFALYDTDDDSPTVIRVPFNVQDVIDRYGDDISSDVARCLLRTPKQKPFGRIMEGLME
jgi:putative phosphoesterase